MATKKVLWVSKHKKIPRRWLDFLKNRIFGGNYVRIDNIPTLGNVPKDVDTDGMEIDDYEKVISEVIEDTISGYDAVVGTVRLQAIPKILNTGVRYYKVVTMKFGNYKYVFQGYSLVMDFSYRDVYKLKGDKVLVMTRHRLLDSQLDLLKRANGGRLPSLVRKTKYVSSSDVVVDWMKRYGTKEVFWVSNLILYKGLLRHGVEPLRFICYVDRGEFLRLVRIFKLKTYDYLVGGGKFVG